MLYIWGSIYSKFLIITKLQGWLDIYTSHIERDWGLRGLEHVHKFRVFKMK